MKAITIQQPYAELISLELKHFETRSWPTKYRGPIAIHAGKELYPITPEIKQAVEAAVFYNGPFHPSYLEDWTRGAVIAIAEITGCYKVIGHQFRAELNGRQFMNLGGTVTAAILENNKWICGNELDFGDYSKGRYAWRLENIQLLKTPIPAKGQQGLWNWDDAAAKSEES